MFISFLVTENKTKLASWHLEINFPGGDCCRGYVVVSCRGYVVTGLTENKTKPSSWGLAELGNKLSRVGVVAEDMW